MIGAIKRRWKSKKSKVLSKGSDLSASTDSCPTSRGFAVDNCEDFDKMIKPPSPRQIHPLLDKSDIKCSHHHYQSSHHPLFSQYPLRKKSSTLPGSEEPPPFIRVNSGRIELVSNAKETSTSKLDLGKNQPSSTEDLVLPNDLTSLNAEGSKTSTGGRNDVRHSWCGGSSLPRDPEVGGKKKQQQPIVNGTSSTTSSNPSTHQKDLEKQPLPPTPTPAKAPAVIITRRNSSNNNSKSYSFRSNPPPTSSIRQKAAAPTSPAKAPRKIDENRRPPPPPPPPPPSSSSEEDDDHHLGKLRTTGDFEASYDDILLCTSDGQKNVMSSSTMSTSATQPAMHSATGNVRVLLSPLKDRLSAIEQLTANLQSWQTTDDSKTSYDECVQDLASQVSRAVQLQQLMKSEFEKLQDRVQELENHNKTMATMIIPTLIKLQSPSSCGPVAGCETKNTPSSSQSHIPQSSHQQLAEKQQPSHHHVQKDCRIPSINGTQSGSKLPRTCTTLSTGSCRSNHSDQTKKTSLMTKSDSRRPDDGFSLIRRSSSSSSSKSDSTLTTSSGINHRHHHNPLSSARNSMTRNNNAASSNTSSINSNGANRSRSTSNNSRVNNNSSSRIPSSKTSAIPRMSSPAPRPPTHSSSSPLLQSPARVRRESSSTSGIQLPPTGSRLPVRRNPLRNPGNSNSEGRPTRTSAGTSRSQAGKFAQKLANSIETCCSNKATINSSSKSASKHEDKQFITIQSSPVTAIVAHAEVSPALLPFQLIKSSKTGKDEGYSTMSSEALAEQEKQSTLDRSTLGRGRTLLVRTGESTPTGTTERSRTMHKSNTFNTFREADRSTSAERQFTSLPVPVSRASILSRHNLPSTSSRSQQGSESTQLQATCSDSTPTASPRHLSSKIPPPQHRKSGPCMTSTPVNRHNNVRIVRGIPHDQSQLEHSHLPSSSTILWEDSDDSDVLFLPLDITSDADSRSFRSAIPECPSARAKSSANKYKETTKIIPTTGYLTPIQDANEDRALIEKWMRRDDAKSQIQPWEDEWAWDWDGVQQPPTAGVQPKSLRSIRECNNNKRTHDDELDREGDDEHDEEDDEEFWRIPSLDYPPEIRLKETPEFSASAEPSHASIQGQSSIGKDHSSSITHIDSSTWTKTKCGKIKNKLVDFFANEQSSASTVPAPPSPKSAAFSQTEPFNQQTVNDSNNECSASRAGNEDGSPPPVIEFTPEFYHLVNYGSNLSFSDNESNPNSPYHLSRLLHCQQHQPVSKSAQSSSINYSGVLPHSTTPLAAITAFTNKSSKMDDKVSQTDFVSSSFESMSISSELSLSECRRNCLEIIKKLVAEDPALAADAFKSTSSQEEQQQPVTTLDRKISYQAAERQADAGSPTTWISIPKGLPSVEVDRILDILSSSESEDILSPSK